MDVSPYYRAFPQLLLPLSFDDWRRLPRNPAYKYEYLDGQAVLTPRAYTRSAMLPLESWHPVRLRRPPALRTLGDRDWRKLPSLFFSAFVRELPFQCLSEPKARALARKCLQHTRQGHDGELVPEACLLAEGEGLEGAALITLQDPRRLALYAEDRAFPRAGKVPHLTWIFVHQFAARRGCGTALLQEVVLRLRGLGHTVLASTFLIGCTGSTLWHWQMGFQLLPSGLSTIFQQPDS